MADAKQVQGHRQPARRRLVLQALGVVVAVVLLLWGADTLARIGAQTLLEQNIQEATGVEVRPEVEVQGLFFLPQVIRGVYSEVHVRTGGSRAGHCGSIALTLNCSTFRCRPRCPRRQHSTGRHRAFGGEPRSDL